MAATDVQQCTDDMHAALQLSIPLEEKKLQENCNAERREAAGIAHLSLQRDVGVQCREMVANGGQRGLLLVQQHEQPLAQQQVACAP